MFPPTYDYDMFGTVKKNSVMTKIQIDENDVTKQLSLLRKIKLKKSAGPDNMKPDLLKLIRTSTICVENIVELLVLNNILNNN